MKQPRKPSDIFRSITKFLAEHHTGLGTIASLASALFIAGGFAATWIQMSNATREVQAANVYQIQKDSRELSSKVYTRAYKLILDNASSTTNYRMALEDTESCERSVECSKCIRDPHCENLDHHFQNGTWLMLNFYLSVYRQSKLALIPPDVTQAFKIDFCSFLDHKPVKYYWNSIVRPSDATGRGKDDHDGKRKPIAFSTMYENWCENWRPNDTI